MKVTREPTFIPTYVPDPQLTPHPEQRQPAVIVPGSRLAVLGVFLECIRGRFSPPNVEPTFQWAWTKDVNTTSLIVESAFAEDVTYKNVRPSIIVDVDDATVGRTVLGDLAGQNLQSGLRGSFHLVTLPILVECIAAKRGESASLADITGIFIQASARLIMAKFSFHDLTPVIIGRTQPAPSDKTKHITPITFSVQYPLRYTERPTAPLLADITAKIFESGEDPQEYLESISLGLSCPNK
jgi:hypothetical protein